MGSSNNNRKGPLKKVQVKRYYSTYSQTGHNSRTYITKIKNISNSKDSNK